MSYSNGIITAPVSINDVKSVIGASSNDLGTLCSHSNINMWAKNKPVSYPSVSKNGNAGYAWKGDEPTTKPYGIVLKISYGEYADDITANLGYKKPSGGSSSPYRLGDFSGYNHNAIVPFSVQLPSGEFPKSQNRILCYIENLNPLPTNNLSLSDIYPNCYFCIIVTDGSDYYYKTIDVSSTSMTLTDCPLWSDGNVGDSLTVVACMADKSISTWSNIVDTVTLYGLKCSGNSVVSTIVIGTPYVTSYVVYTSFSDGKQILRASSAVYSAGNVVASARYINPQALTLNDNYILSSISVSSVGKTSGSTQQKTITSGNGIGSLEVGYNAYKENPSAKVELTCSGGDLPVFAGEVAEHTITFNFEKY